MQWSVFFFCQFFYSEILGDMVLKCVGSGAGGLFGSFSFFSQVTVWETDLKELPSPESLKNRVLIKVFFFVRKMFDLFVLIFGMLVLVVLWVFLFWSVFVFHGILFRPLHW